MMDVRDGASDRAECMGEQWESHSGRSCRMWSNGSQIDIGVGKTKSACVDCRVDCRV